MREDAYDDCAALVRAADPDRFLATLFAPARHRPALHALYAFNVEVARVRAAVRGPLPGEIRLQWWRDALAGEARGEVQANPVAAALLDTIARYRLPTAPLADLIEARAFDLYDDPMPSLDALTAYASKTSSALMVAAATILLEETHPRAALDQLAGHAGVGYALAGLLAAFAVQTARRQLYVPLDLLARHGAAPEDVFAGPPTPALRSALAELRAHARSHLRQASVLVAAVPPAVGPAILPAALARLLLDRMERPGYDPARPVVVPAWRRPWTLWRASRYRLGARARRPV